MPAPKLKAPDQLPSQGVTDVIFQKWLDQLTTYLSQFDDYELFLPGGRYATWTCAEDDPNRIAAVANPDTTAVQLTKRRSQLNTFLSIIAGCCQDADYGPVRLHSTSFEWIAQKLREDHDIQRKGIHFLNIIDLKYDPTKDTPTGFYNTY